MHIDRVKGTKVARVRRLPCAVVVACLVLLSRLASGACEFTVTIEATLKNMTPSRPLPFTVDAAGRSSFELVKFRPTDKTQPSRYNYRYFWQPGGRRPSTSNDADYAIPFGPGRYVVMQGPRGSYSHFPGSDSENAVNWTVAEGTIVAPRGKDVSSELNRIPPVAGRTGT